MSTKDKIYYIQSMLQGTHTKYYTILQYLIKNHKIEHSSNMNGIFLNLSTIDPAIIDTIYEHFINAKDNVDVIYTTPTVQAITISTHTDVVSKPDKLHVEKFDKYILQLSRTNLYI